VSCFYQFLWLYLGKLLRKRKFIYLNENVPAIRDKGNKASKSQ